MKLFEYEGKQLFAEAGIPVPASRLVQVGDGGPQPAAADPVEACVDAAKELGGPVVIKAQLDMGGRGKAGLVRPATDPGVTRQVARAILDSPYTIPALLVEETVAIERELYVSISVDAPAARYVVLASAEGGVEIEELARTNPDAIRRLSIDPFQGMMPHQARGLAYDLGLEGATAKAFADLLARLYRVFSANDAELAEINPVFITAPGEDGARRVIAGDAKVIVDDNSLGRRERFTMRREQFESDAAYEAALEGIPYVQFDGNISLMCAGAGLTTTVFDLVNDEGGRVANYLEFGGPNYRKARRAMELCLKNDSAVILIVTFGTIARADVMAEGVVEAIAALKPDRPIVTCIRGTNEEGAHATLEAAGLEPLYDTEVAVRRAVELAAAAGPSGAGPNPAAGPNATGGAS